MRPLPRRVAPVAALVTAFGFSGLVLAPAAHAGTVSTTFSYTGSEQTFVVPPGITSIYVVAVGGPGGDWAPGQTSDVGGFGATVSALLDVTGGETLYVEVGGPGTPLVPSLHELTPGGFNGGGSGNPQSVLIGLPGAGGGGASDLRTVSAATPGSLGSRLVVAGGGGGAAAGASGGASSLTGSPGAKPDQQCNNHPAEDIGGAGGGAGATSGGAGGAPAGIAVSMGPGEAGVEGVGGAGGYLAGLLFGGGGGGGYFGGGGGGVGGACAGAGGGGSSFVMPGTPASFGTDSTGTPQITISYGVGAPQATTEPASGIGQSAATLNGVVNPEGLPTSYFFEYGTTPDYGSQTDTVDADSAATAKGVSTLLSGLSPGTVYYFQLVATNADGTTYGGQQTVTTAGAARRGRAPAAVTEPASRVGWHQAALNGVVDPRGASTTYYFEYGRTRSYGSRTAVGQAGAGYRDESLHAQLSGLARHTTYHFRLVATNAHGTTRGVDRAFRTR